MTDVRDNLTVDEALRHYQRPHDHEPTPLLDLDAPAEIVSTESKGQLCPSPGALFSSDDVARTVGRPAVPISG